MNILAVIISFIASVFGNICGIGGGIIIKPVLDLMTPFSPAVISFLSGITVLCMTGYSVIHSFLKGSSSVNVRISTKLGIGAAAGGILGKYLFGVIRTCWGDGNQVAAVQAGLLVIVTMGTLLYTVRKSRISRKHFIGTGIILGAGLLLGVISSFLGIGGGPLNLVVLYYMFSMETKEAAQNSLYIILISQSTSLLYSVISGTLPEGIPVVLAICMAIAGISGAITGRAINRRIPSRKVDRLFIGVQILIIGICVYNLVRNIVIK